jgi:alpha/beta superfamily hydrolase
MSEILHRKLFIRGPAGQLESLLWTYADDNPELTAVVCHPHPLFAGTMHNKVVYQTAKALHLRGIPVLRFNFRGAGLSEGVHSKGAGEQGDVRAVLDFMAAQYPKSELLLAGFSFGSWVGLRVGCGDARVTDLIGLGLPVNGSDLSYLQECTKPKLFIQGGNDEFGSRENIEALFAALPEPKQLVIVESADHFFRGQLNQVASAINQWLDLRHPRTNENRTPD